LKPEFLALWLALSYYTSCFIAEIVRAGILAVSHGQTEASYALGLRPNRTLQLVILPQALRIIVPPLVSQYLNLTKNSSLAIAIGYMDVVATIGGISLMQTGKEVETMIIVLGTYLVLSLTISAFMNWFNRSIKLKER
jgi:general L-amino acid transport system permease protein